MQIILYYTSSDRFDLNKQLQTVTTLDNVHPVDPNNVLSPTFKLGSISRAEVMQANYAYIPDYNRYYYLDSPVVINNQSFYLNMNVDPLMSFKTAIKNLQCIIAKAEDTDVINNDLNDGSFINQEGRWIEFIVYKDSTVFLDTPKNILVVGGG